MLAAILIAFLAAGVSPWLVRAWGWQAAILLAAVPAGMVGYFGSYLPLEPGQRLDAVLPWIPSLGISLAFRLDGLSATFALLICGIGTLILLYTAGYMRGDPGLGRLCGLLLMFMGAMLGIVLSDDIFALFVFWELTSISSYLLIGFKHEKELARSAARQALLVTGAGGLCLLAGLLLWQGAAVAAGLPPVEATRVSALCALDLSDQPWFLPALVLIVLGALSKSAQMPLHFWLPNAMAAPTPVSAYLHSATMVKAGVYLLARVNPAFGESVVWHLLLTSAGAVTMLVAAGMAAGQSDLKRILAYTTVAVLGTLTMLIGVGTDLALKAAVVYLVAHACYKAALFMIAGSVEHATGSRDVRELGGLWRLMPLSAAAGLLAALSMAGAPPLFGFIGKELLFKAKLNLEWLGVVLIVVASLANVFLIAMALVVAVWPFFGKRTAAAKEAHEAPAWMVAGPLVLAVAGLFVGVIPGAFDAGLGSAMASAIGGREIAMKLKLWHGLSPVALTAMGISALTLAAGFALFLRLRDWLTHIGMAVRQLGRRGPAQGYELLFDGTMAAAQRITDVTQTGSLRAYVRITLLTLVAVSVLPLMRCFPPDDTYVIGLVWYEVLLVFLLLAGALAAATSPSRLAAIALLGITGILIAVVFALYSAPDLALTQIMVEALTVILLVLIFYRLPGFVRLRDRMARVRDFVVAVLAGVVMTGFVLASASVHLPTTVSEQLTQSSKTEAYGRNVVNVILVDFRALDTLGEITVVAVAALGAYALVRLYRRALPRKAAS